MKKTVLINILFVLCAIFTSCSKDKQTLINTNWKAESVKAHTDSIWQYPTPPETAVLKFENNNRYSFLRCSGKVRLMKNRGINFMVKFCDYPGLPDFCTQCESTLYKTTHYELFDNKLILKGDSGKIINFIKVE